MIHEPVRYCSLTKCDVDERENIAVHEANDRVREFLITNKMTQDRWNIYICENCKKEVLEKLRS